MTKALSQDADRRPRRSSWWRVAEPVLIALALAAFGNLIGYGWQRDDWHVTVASALGGVALIAVSVTSLLRSR